MWGWGVAWGCGVRLLGGILAWRMGVGVGGCGLGARGGVGGLAWWRRKVVALWERGVE